MKSVRLPAALVLILVLTGCTSAYRGSEGGYGPDVLRLRSAAVARTGGSGLFASR